MQAGISTANAVKPMIEVMNQAHALSGSRISDMPLQRMSSVVVMKFNEPSNWPIQKMDNRSCPEDHAQDPGQGRQPSPLR